MGGGEVLVQRALPRKLLATVLALGALVHALPALVHRTHVLNQVAVAPKHLAALAALERLGTVEPVRGVDRPDVVVEVGQR